MRDREAEPSQAGVRLRGVGEGGRRVDRALQEEGSCVSRQPMLRAKRSIEGLAKLLGFSGKVVRARVYGSELAAGIAPGGVCLPTPTPSIALLALGSESPRDRADSAYVIIRRSFHAKHLMSVGPSRRATKPASPAPPLPPLADPRPSHAPLGNFERRPIAAPESLDLSAA
jgi:hypothetical protein